MVRPGAQEVKLEQKSKVCYADGEQDGDDHSLSLVGEERSCCNAQQSCVPALVVVEDDTGKNQGTEGCNAQQPETLREE